MTQQQIVWAFSILGISQNSNRDEAKRAYRTLCKKYHPDMNPEGRDTSKEYLYVNQAFEIVNQYFDYLELCRKQMEIQMQASASYVTGGRIYGDNAMTRKNYEQMQQRKSETVRLKKWEMQNKEKEKQQQRKMHEKYGDYKRGGGLPSKRQQEFEKRQEIKKEAERIALIIEKLLQAEE